MGSALFLSLALFLAWTTLVSLICFAAARTFWPGLIVSLAVSTGPILLFAIPHGLTISDLWIFGFFLTLALPPTVIVGMLVSMDRRPRKPQRADTAHCRKCGYNLTGNTSGRCPECGESI